MARNSPNSVGSTVSAARSIWLSVRRMWAMRSAMEIIFRPCSSANRRQSGARIMVPSSLTSSAIAPAGDCPANRARSTAASVWPARRSTPPGTARSGKTWPGRVSSKGSVAESASTRIVWARSAAEMPVETPSRASTETV